MPSIQDFAREQVHTTVEVRGVSINVWYSPDNLRMRDIDMLTRARRDQDFGLMTRAVKRFVDEWDITGPLVDEDTDEVLVEEGEVIPFEVRCLEVLGFAFLTEFLDSIETEAVEGPNPTPAKTTGRSKKR